MLCDHCCIVNVYILSFVDQVESFSIDWDSVCYEFIRLRVDSNDQSKLNICVSLLCWSERSIIKVRRQIRTIVGSEISDLCLSCIAIHLVKFRIEWIWTMFCFLCSCFHIHASSWFCVYIDVYHLHRVPSLVSSHSSCLHVSFLHTHSSSFAPNKLDFWRQIKFKWHVFKGSSFYMFNVHL